MFQTTRRRLAIWYTAVTAVLLLLFASGFYLYVRSTLVERVDDTLNHVVEIVQRSLVIEPVNPSSQTVPPRMQINLEDSFRNNEAAVDDDHIDLEWFDPNGNLLWSTFSNPPLIPVHLNPSGETVRVARDDVLRQITQRVEVGRQVLGYLRVSHPWFEVTKPTRQLIIDLSLWTALMVGAIAAIGWFLSGLAMAPVHDSYQRLKQFTADASHELRNPIAVIQTNVQVALSDPDPQWQQQQLQVVERLTRRLGRLVDDLLFLARQDSNIVQLQTSSISLYTLLMEVIEEQQAIALDKSITLMLELPDEPDDNDPTTSSLDVIQGDRDQLTRLFTNLISNAIRFTPEFGEIHVVLQQRFKSYNPAWEIQVKDTGIGIPPEALPHLFDRFYRVDPARTHAANGRATASTTGSGLGLAIARAIVENHQGQIHVESAIGSGTTFTVTLPCHITLPAQRGSEKA